MSVLDLRAAHGILADLRASLHALACKANAEKWRAESEEGRQLWRGRAEAYGVAIGKITVAEKAVATARAELTGKR